MKAVITVTGIDKIGIIANVSVILADNKVNIEDISQTTMQGYFMMYMLVDISNMSVSFNELSEKLQMLKNGTAQSDDGSFVPIDMSSVTTEKTVFAFSGKSDSKIVSCTINRGLHIFNNPVPPFC